MSMQKFNIRVHAVTLIVAFLISPMTWAKGKHHPKHCPDIAVTKNAASDWYAPCQNAYGFPGSIANSRCGLPNSTATAIAPWSSNPAPNSK